MANLEEITSYKNKLAMSFCTSEAVASLVRMPGDENLKPHDFLYERIFPYAHVPEITETGKCFICFEIDVPLVKSNVVKAIEIRVYVMAHRNIVRLPDGQGMRIDVLSSVIDKMLNGSTDYGLGSVELTSWKSFNPISGYYGRILKYSVCDINRSMCVG